MGDADEIPTIDPAGSGRHPRRWIPIALVVAVLGVGAGFGLLSGGGDTRSVAPAATTDASASSTAEAPLTSSPTPTSGEPEASDSVVVEAAPSTSAAAVLPGPSATRSSTRPATPTTVNSATECLVGCAWAPVGSNCVSLPVSVVLFDPQGIASAEIDWSYPRDGSIYFGHTTLSGPIGAPQGEWRGTAEMPVPPQLNFFGTVTVVDGAGVSSGVGWQIPAPQCGTDTTSPPTSDPSTSAPTTSTPSDSTTSTSAPA